MHLGFGQIQVVNEGMGATSECGLPNPAHSLQNAVLQMAAAMFVVGVTNNVETLRVTIGIFFPNIRDSKRGTGLVLLYMYTNPIMYITFQ